MEHTKFGTKLAFYCVIPQLIQHYLSDHPGSCLRRVSYPITFALSLYVLKYFLEKHNKVAVKYGDFILAFIMIFTLTEESFFKFPDAFEINPP
jgi:hypothetical protein